MQIDTAGTYTLKYIAEDACGNITEAEREVEAFQITYRTVIYADKTLIINEKSTDIDTNTATHGTETVSFDPMSADGSNYVFETAPWRRYIIKKVEFGSQIAPISMANWFSMQQFLTTFDAANLDVSKVVSFANAFRNCSSLTSLDVAGWVTDKTTDISGMFANSTEFTQLDVSNWDTSNVTNMQDVFLGCIKLTQLDVSNWNTEKVTNMEGVFDYCYRLPSIDVSRWDTKNVTDMSRLFRVCASVATLDLSNWDTSKVTAMSDMFAGTSSINNLNLTTIYVSNKFVTTAVTSSQDMFLYCTTKLTGGAGTKWNVNNPQDKTYAHIDGGTSNPGYFTAQA